MCDFSSRNVWFCYLDFQPAFGSHIWILAVFFLGYFTGSKCFAESTFSGVRTVDIGMVKVVILFSKQTWIMFSISMLGFYPKLPIHSACNIGDNVVLFMFFIFN
jgi:hypothetical protein